MVYRIAADFVALLHIFFVLFVIFGATLVWRWPRLAFGHIPVFIWGGFIFIGVLVLLGNVSVYFFLWRKHRTL
jgi:hypothetical protein